jgi:hypothetical protein
MMAHNPAFLMAGGHLLVFPPSSTELERLATPSIEVKAKVASFLPITLAWYDSTEQSLLPRGRPLTTTEYVNAHKLGVKQPEKVRVIVTDTFPVPNHPLIAQAAKEFGLGSDHEEGRTMGYAILLKSHADQTTLNHELVHVSQIERLGQKRFLERYLYEIEILGYARAPLELEAFIKQSLV